MYKVPYMKRSTGLNWAKLGFKLRLRDRLYAPDGYLSGSEIPRCGTFYVGSAGSTEVSG